MPDTGHPCVETVRALPTLRPLSRLRARAVSAHLMWSVALLGACGEAPAPTPAATPALAAPVYPEPQLAAGRAVWLDSCKGCHDIGVAGAPRLGDRQAWAPRIAKGLPTLHQHALDGFFGPAGTMMPPRGGNARLTDAEVIAAVDYMVAASGDR